MSDSFPSQLRFFAIAGFSVRADIDGGAMSSDFGALLLRGADQQIGLISRLTRAIHDKRHPSYIEQPMADLLSQSVFQTACGYNDGNDANGLRSDPMFKLAVVLRPGKRPTGKENAAIMKRVLRLLRQAWPETHIVLRGDGHFSNPELMALRDTDSNLDFIFGLAGNKVLPPRPNPCWSKRAPCTRPAARTPATTKKQNPPPRDCTKMSSIGLALGRAPTGSC